jgi:hypothetical protein
MVVICSELQCTEIVGCTALHINFCERENYEVISTKVYMTNDIVSCRPIAKRRLNKQWPLLGNARNNRRVFSDSSKFFAAFMSVDAV